VVHGQNLLFIECGHESSKDRQIRYGTRELDVCTDRAWQACSLGPAPAGFPAGLLFRIGKFTQKHYEFGLDRYAHDGFRASLVNADWHVDAVGKLDWSMSQSPFINER
jgi:hypothetical protein